jgi:hypothetical protein
MVRNATIPSRTAVQRTFTNLRHLKQLYLAADLLHRHFSAVLAINCFQTFLTMLTSSYYIIEFYKRGIVTVLCWGCSDVIEALFAFLAHLRYERSDSRNCNYIISYFKN